MLGITLNERSIILGNFLWFGYVKTYSLLQARIETMTAANIQYVSIGMYGHPF
jgi:hypothetical protein